MVATVPDDQESDLRTRFAGFLDEFYGDPDPASQRSRVEEEPRRTDDDKLDAFLGAIGEHLCRRWMLGDAPRWPLRRASMPRDGRWWHYETMRTGIVPTPTDVEPACRCAGT